MAFKNQNSFIIYFIIFKKKLFETVNLPFKGNQNVCYFLWSMWSTDNYSEWVWVYKCYFTVFFTFILFAAYISAELCFVKSSLYRVTLVGVSLNKQYTKECIKRHTFVCVLFLKINHSNICFWNILLNTI